MNFNYDDVDLFDFHMIDFYISRLSSILTYGITSTSYATSHNLPHFSRNYTKPSNSDNYISVFNFSRNIFMYSRFINELYEYSKKRIVFIMQDLPYLNQASPNSKYYCKSIREVYIKDVIQPNNILGIALRYKDAIKPLGDLDFGYKIENENNFVIAALNEIKFLSSLSNFDINEFYTLIGKYFEAREKKDDTTKKECLMLMKEFLKSKTIIVFKKLLKKDNITILDIIKYFTKDNYPIYLLGKYEFINSKDDLSSFKDISPFNIDKESQLIGTKMQKFDYFVKKEIKKMSDYGKDIYTEEKSGPLTTEDNIVLKRILKYKRELGL